jgi:hypothetical protein
MPFFHATFKKHLPSILRNGLGGQNAQQNWPGIEGGVYLSELPAISLLVMVEQYYHFGQPDSIPRDHFAEIVVIVIDDSRVDRDRLAIDPLITNHPVFRYPGVIDVTGMPIVPFDDMVTYAQQDAPITEQ